MSNTVGNGRPSATREGGRRTRRASVPVGPLLAALFLAGMLSLLLLPVISSFFHLAVRGSSLRADGGGDGGGAPEVEDTRAWEQDAIGYQSTGL